ncbi:beta-N-acetylhexosaminidase [Bacteroidia bacterium]|nr:beta-N-acetylhexosaminidase [Bacteroidia bacterium]
MKMKTVSKYCVAACILSGFYACKEEIVQEYAVLPEPQQIEYANGSFKLKDKLTIAFPPELANEAAYCRDVACHVSYVAQDISQDISHDVAQHDVAQDVARHVSTVELKEGKKSGDITLVLDASVLPEHPEGYVLDIKKRQITIKANAPAGILHGIQTLRQLFGAASLQCGTITDYPQFPWRAFMLDESRYFQGKEAVFRLLDNMARLKMNVFHWHLTDRQGWRIEIKKYPELIKTGTLRDSTVGKGWGDTDYKDGYFDLKPHGGFYMQDEIREVVAYAAARHITIVPEIEMPGHADAAIVAYPWLGTTGKQFKIPCNLANKIDIFNVTDPKVLDFFHDVLTEVMALFPGKVIHIGGDEVHYPFWTDSPSIRKYMKDNGFQTPADLQIDFTNKMSQWITSKNRRMMGWQDITGAKIYGQSADDKDVEQKLALGTVVQAWRGDPALIKKTIEDGYDIVNSYHSYTYLDYNYRSIPLKKAYSFNPIPEGLTAEQQKRVLGLGCQMWTEFVPNEQKMNTQVYPRIAAYAETGWTAPDKKEYSRFLKSLDYFLTDWKKQGIEYGPVE